MQVNTNWYWYPYPQQHVITVPTCKILHPQLEVNSIADFHDISKIVCNRTQVKKSISRHPICLTDSDYDEISEEIGRRDKIEFKQMQKFIVMTKKSNTIISNEYYMYLLCNYILTFIRYFYLFILFGANLMFLSIYMYAT